jgi:hypothetical protein
MSVVIIGYIVSRSASGRSQASLRPSADLALARFQRCQVLRHLCVPRSIAGGPTQLRAVLTVTGVSPCIAMVCLLPPFSVFRSPAAVHHLGRIPVWSRIQTRDRHGSPVRALPGHANAPSDSGRSFTFGNSAGIISSFVCVICRLHLFGVGVTLRSYPAAEGPRYFKVKHLSCDRVRD